MLQTTTLIVVVGSLASLLVAVPLTDNKNQRSPMFPLTGNSDNVNNIRMIPPNLRDNTDLDCEKPGFFADPRNCSQFYRCVDIGQTGYFTTFNFECTTGVFYEKSISCIEGPCPITSPIYGESPGTEVQIIINEPPITDPAPPPAGYPRPPPINPGPILPPLSDFPRPLPPLSPDNIIKDPSDIKEPSDFAPAPPEPPKTSPETTDTQKPQWLNEIPPWFKETPWWFNTAPAWFHQPPAWFGGVPTITAIEEDITIEDSEPTVTDIDAETGELPTNNEKNINTGKVSISGAEASFTKDNKTIRIHIPIHIIQHK